MWTIFLKSFIEFVAILLLFYVLVFWPAGMWDVRSQPGIEPTHFLHWNVQSSLLDHQGVPLQHTDSSGQMVCCVGLGDLSCWEREAGDQD